MHRRFSGLFVCVVGALAAGGATSCAATGDDVDSGDDALSAGAQPTVDGIPSAFEKDRLMEDAFYAAPTWATTGEIQAFLDKTVWGHPSWLATQKLHLVGDPDTAPDVSIAEAITRTATAHGINPLLLLARMQVEKSLVSPSAPPAASAQNFGLGCHKVTADHPNGLDPSVAPLPIQLECGATTLATQLDRARQGQNQFKIGQDAKTQDGVSVHPENATTSALYSYTPIEGTQAHNGNWLAWNISLRFASAIQTARGGSEQE